jgi:hypothetical protein
MLCACQVEAQQNATVRLTVDLQDQTGARIPGASLTAIDTATGASLRATADATGQAIVHLAPGIYDVTARANGFDPLKQRTMRLDADQEWDFTLRVSSYGDPIIFNGPLVTGPLALDPEHQTVSADIQAEPVQQLALPARPLHHKRHLF